MAELTRQIAEWSSSHPAWMAVASLCLQVALLGVATLALNRLRERLQSWSGVRPSASASYAAWLIAACLLVFCVPFQFFAWGLTIAVSKPQSAPAMATADPMEDPHSVFRTAGAIILERSTFATSQQSDAIAEALSDGPLVDDFSDQPATPSFETSQTKAPTPSVSNLNADANELSKSALAGSLETSRSGTGDFLFSAMLVVYLAVVSWMLLRFLSHTLRLSKCIRHGDSLGALSIAIAEESARQLELSALPRLRVTDVAVPMACGVHQSTVLLPRDFPSWTATEQRTVFLHEFSHVLRRDIWGEVLSQLLAIVYWFHPAAWLVVRRLRQTRELATDQRVVESGIDGKHYARDLVTVLERLAGLPSGGSKCASAAVAMSAFSDTESRLKHVLKVAGSVVPTPQERRRRLRSVFIVCLALLGVFLASSVRLSQDAAAQETPPAEPATANEKPSDSDDTFATRLENLSSETTWFERFEECQVLEVPAESGGVVFNISGQVLAPDGTPIPNAIVVLREWSGQRNSAAPRGSEVGRLQEPVSDVFARTMTDAQGRFAFTNAIAPKIPIERAKQWGWDVVAATSEFVAWHHVPNQDSLDTNTTITMQMRKTETISGKIVSPEGEPIQGASISLPMIGIGKEEAFFFQGGENEFDSLASQLIPLARTSQSGTFQISGIPTSTAIVAVASHPDWAEGHACIASSRDVIPRVLSVPKSFPDSFRNLVDSPARIEMDPGVVLRGRVTDEDGQGIADVRVSWISSSQYAATDSQGRFALRVASMNLDRVPDNEPIRFNILPAGESEFLHQSFATPKDSVRVGKPVEIQLEKGVQVSGSLITSGDNAPLSNALFHTPRNSDDPASTPYGGRTDEQGRFQFKLPIGVSRLAIGTDKPGFQLPSERDVMFATEVQVGKWQHIDVDTSDGEPVELPPVMVEQSGTVKIVAVLPDGSFAANASVVIKDEEPARKRTGQSYPSPPRLREITDTVRTNERGQAELKLQGSPTDKARVHVNYSTPVNSYMGEASLNQMDDWKLNVHLKQAWTVRGSVTLDGQPVKGARVSIGQSTPLNRNGLAGGFTVSNFVYAVTNESGEYAAAVEPDKQYSTSLQSVPGQQSGFYSGYRPTPDPNDPTVLFVQEYALVEGSGQIGGRVVGNDGRPVPGAHVSIRNAPNVNAAFWIGHRDASQTTTDANGRFHLRKVPDGEYDLFITGPRVGNQRAANATVKAKTGNLLVRVPLDTTSPRVTPRLKIKEITDIEENDQ